jgi:hypothetical protein
MRLLEQVGQMHAASEPEAELLGRSPVVPGAKRRSVSSLMLAKLRDAAVPSYSAARSASSADAAAAKCSVPG